MSGTILCDSCGIYAGPTSRVFLPVRATRGNDGMKEIEPRLVGFVSQILFSIAYLEAGVVSSMASGWSVSQCTPHGEARSCKIRSSPRNSHLSLAANAHPFRNRCNPRACDTAWYPARIFRLIARVESLDTRGAFCNRIHNRVVSGTSVNKSADRSEGLNVSVSPGTFTNSSSIALYNRIAPGAWRGAFEP
jgi:hypothetical protein